MVLLLQEPRQPPLQQHPLVVEGLPGRAAVAAREHPRGAARVLGELTEPRHRGRLAGPADGQVADRHDRDVEAVDLLPAEREQRVARGRH
jgi:hypothetical protein